MNTHEPSPSFNYFIILPTLFQLSSHFLPCTYINHIISMSILHYEYTAEKNLKKNTHNIIITFN